MLACTREGEFKAIEIIELELSMVKSELIELSAKASHGNINILISHA
jgi:hypothetical protein